MKNTIKNTQEKIENFRDLPNGWNFGEGIRINDSVIKSAKDINLIAYQLGFQTTDAFPGPNGEIQINIYQRNSFFEFTIEPDESITFIFEFNGKVKSYIENINLVDVFKFIKEYRDITWALSESYQTNFMIQRIKDSLAWRSNRVPTTKSPYFAMSALVEPVERYVNTSKTSTMASQENLQSFGKSQPIYSLTSAL